MIPFFIMLPLGTAFVMALIAKADERVQDILAIIATLSLFTISVLTLMSVNASAAHLLLYRVNGTLPPAGLALVVDGLSAFMLVTVNLVASFVAVYSSGYMKKYTDKWKFYSLFFLMLSGINGVLVASDIFNLYVFMEIAAISAYFLVAFGTEAEELEASFKYAIMGSVASCFILLGVAFLYAHTSTLNLAGIAQAISATGPTKVLQFVSVLFLMGFGLKAALAPFHSWLAYAHSSAPAPVSAMLSGVLIKVLGIYAISRIFFSVFGASPQICQILISLGVLSMVIGAILAFGSTDIKRLFAYSTVSQIGYVVLALGVATPLAFVGAIFYIFNHSIVKSLLFLTSGSIERLTGTRELDKISGMVNKAPGTGYTALAGALSLCGVPPMGGFWAKLIIIFACVQAGRPVLALIAALVGVMTIAYYFRPMTSVLFGTIANASVMKKRANVAINIAMAGLAAIVVAAPLVLMPGARKVFIDGAIAVLINGTNYANLVFGAIR